MVLSFTVNIITLVLCSPTSLQQSRFNYSLNISSHALARVSAGDGSVRSAWGDAAVVNGCGSNFKV